MKTKIIVLLISSCTMPLPGAPRSSANYSIAAEAADGGGRRCTSASYTHDGSAGLIAGIATVASPAETAKAGYVGQLYDATGLAVTASPTSLNENATRQLAASQLLDDATSLVVSPNSVAWAVLSGPISAISTAGVASAAAVFQNTTANVQGTYAGFPGTLNLTVLDNLPDNYGSYAGDGLDDSWQYQYFGLNNPHAGPTQDPDGDSQLNLFEFTAGLVPTDSNSRFNLRIEPVPGLTAAKRLIFSPRWTDRSYNVLISSALEAGGWSTLTGATTTDNGTERTVTDPNSGAPSRKFYRVQVVKP